MRTVKEVMKPVVNISPSQTVLEAAKLMKSSDRGSLLIVDGKITVGIITERDLVTRVIAEIGGVTGILIASDVLRLLSNKTLAEDIWEALVERQ